MLPGEVDGKRFLRAMARFGCRVSRTSGSHKVLKSEPSGRVIVVAFHSALSRNSIRRALRDAGIDEAEFEDAL